MAHLTSSPQSHGYGFDPSRSLLVLPVRKTHSLYLVAGADLDVRIDKEEFAGWSEGALGSTKGANLTSWESQQTLRRLVVEGRKTGTASLSAYLPDGRPWIKPLEIRVVSNSDARQAEDNGMLTPALRAEVQKLSFRDALIRVAEDQRFSALGRSGSGGNGKYDAAGINWCGSFVHWCYEAVSRAKGVENPFGSAARENNSLRSGIKALYAGMKDEGKFTVIRYEGPDRFGGLKKVQKFIDISAANPVQRGDICLPRSDHGDTFPHVSMVYDPPVGSGPFTTIDGNQTGSYRPEGASPYCIDVNTHDTNAKLPDGKTYKFAFVHVKGA
ncbi:MAG: hypothetical protein GC160_23535 [Acidobacteria bacterium]|nr:hypothetical protein [Acidobacteriota bacterium]